MSITAAPGPSGVLADDEDEARDPRSRFLLSSRPWVMVVAQFFPVLALAVVYPQIVAPLSAGRFAGTGLAVLIVSCAVITPTLAQAVAAPVYLHLLGERGVDPGYVARTVLRVTAPAVLIVAPLLLAASIGVGAARQLPVPAYLAFFGLLALHVLMGALMVPAYALRSAVLLVVPWTAYVVALALAPTAIWAPPSAAVVVQVLVLGLIALGGRGGARVRHPRLRIPFRASFAAALRGAAEGLPLWSIPVVVWLIDVRMESIGFIYVALLPGVLAHQLFFVRVVDPAWRRLEEARAALASEPYRVARERFDRFAGALAAGVTQATILLVMLSMVLITSAIVMRWEHGALLLVIVVAAFAAVVAMMQGYVIAMVGSVLPLGLLGTAAVVVVVVGVALRLPDVLVLGAAAGLYLLFAAISVGVARRTMHRPEYALFWRRAVAL